MVYEWMTGSRKSGLDAQKVGERLSKIHDKHGMVTADLVVRDARRKASPLHSGFEWNDTVAADAHRLHQARNICNALVISHPTGEGDERMVRAFVHIEEGYEDINIVLSVAYKREALLAQALAELESSRNKYAHLSELAAVFSALDKAQAA